MNETERKRLSLLRKRNHLNQILPKILGQLISIESELENARTIEVEEVQELVYKLRENNQETTFIKRVPQSNPELIYSLLEILKNELDTHNLFSTDKLHELWYVEVNTKKIASRFEEVVNIDEDCFLIHDIKLQNGLSLDINEEYWIRGDTTTREWVYELKVWGEEWTTELFSKITNL